MKFNGPAPEKINGRLAMVRATHLVQETACGGMHSSIITVFCVGGCLPVLLDASFATTADAETVISHLISLDVTGTM